jgi:YidC/Oxa1 family membrane protein insertase
VAEPSPEKRILLAFGLSFLVLVVWSSYLRTTRPPPEAPPAPAPRPAAAEPAPARPPEQPAAPVVEPTAPPPVSEVRQGSVERIITIETDVATIVFSTHGATVRSWRLKDFRDDAEEPVELVRSGQTHTGYPLSLALADAGVEEKLNDALFVADAPADTLTAPGELLFEWSDGQLAARKRFRFDRDYLVEIETVVVDAGQPLEHRLAWLGGFGEPRGQDAAYGLGAQVFVRPPAGLQRQPAGQAGQESGWLWKRPSPFPIRGEAAYAGIEDQYFVALFLPRRPQLSAEAWTREWTPAEGKKQLVGEVTVGVANGNALRLFVGPKDIDILKQLRAPAFPSGFEPVLADELVDFGWFWWVAKPLFLAMKWIYEHWVPNYGWVIVLLTVIINLALFPLRWKSMQSAFKMQKVAPQIKVIQERYKQYKFNDPRKQAMQQEIMAVYKEHGINPLGGCLPLLFQLPFFYGFYKVVALSIEMRHAPWILWIRDLSHKDPYYVLPVTMAITMYLSMKMTPMTGADPRQQKMMQVMMLVFAFMFLQVSAGLVLYWLASSVVGLGQQLWINRWQHQHDQAEKEAAKQRKKKKRHQATEEEKA